MARLLRGFLMLAAVTGSLSCSTTANVTEVTMSLDSEGLRKRSIFYTDSKEIHCLAEIGIGRDGVTIEGVIRQQQRWDATSRQYVPTNRVLASAEASPTRGSTAQIFDIELIKQGPTGETGDSIPFQLGRYRCEIKLDGVDAGSALFNIQEPPCPTAQIQPETVCAGFYTEGKQCPAYGLTSTDPATCTCSTRSGWSCQ